jgi:hypothetical protein
VAREALDGRDRRSDAEPPDRLEEHGAENAGAVLFESIGPSRTRIDLTVDAEPDSPIEAAGDALGFLQRRVKGDLDRFKSFIERRGSPTGAWRGEIHGDEVGRDQWP